MSPVPATRNCHQIGDDQSVGWAEVDRRRKASQAVHEALEEEKAALAALRRALEAQ